MSFDPATGNPNKFSGVSNIPYNIIQYLFKNEDIWKLIYYTTPDALLQPNLTPAEKAGLVWKGEDNQEKFRVYLTPVQENIQTSQPVILRLYLVDANPVNLERSMLTYSVEMLCQTKLGMLSNGIPRMDMLWELVMGELIGKQVNGIGTLMFDSGRQANPQCRLKIDLENNRTAMGYGVALGLWYSDVK